MNHTKIIGICSQKGGCAKTTTAIEISACLGDLGKKVLLIDMDQQRDATYSSGCLDQNNIYDVFVGNCTYADAIQKTQYYDLIAGSASLSKADKIFVDADDIFLLADVCEAIKNECEYDYIVIDNPPARNIILNMTYIAADFVIAPTLSDENSLRGITEIAEDLKKYREGRQKLSHAYIRVLILARYKKSNANNMALKNLESYAQSLEKDAFVEQVRECTTVSEVKSAKVPLQSYDKYGNASVDYRRIAKKIIEMEV